MRCFGSKWRTSFVWVSALVVAKIVVPSPAVAVGVIFSATPQAYAVTFLYEDWTRLPSNAFGFFDQTERLNAPTSIRSVQSIGIDSVGNACTDPCTGLTADAMARFDGGGMKLQSYAHTYANFDDAYTTGTPPNLNYHPAYASGNILRAESSAAVYDRLTVTQTVQIYIQGYLTGRSTYSSGSPLTETLAAELPGVDFGHGTVQGQLQFYLFPAGQQIGQVYAMSFPAFFNEVVSFNQNPIVTRTLTPGEYIVWAELRATTRIGSASGTTLAAQDMTADFDRSAYVYLLSSNPSAITSQSGLLTFVPEPSAGLLGATATLCLAGLSRRRSRVRPAAPRR